jgi:hypothetical protein
MQLRSQNATLSESNARLEERLLEAIGHFHAQKDEKESLQRHHEAFLIRAATHEQTYKCFPPSLQGKIEMLEAAGDIMLPGVENVKLPSSNRCDAFNMDELLEYEYKSWVSAQAKGVDAPEIISDNDYDATLFVHFLKYFLSKTLPPSDTPETLSSDNSVDMKALVNILASVHDCRDKCFVSPVALATAITLSSKTSSAEAIDMVGNLVPGGVTKRYVDSCMDKAVGNVGDLNKLRCQNHCRAVGVYDNNGIYTQVREGGGER